MRALRKITIKGFKSIRDQTLELDRLNVFIGGNGVGKSNLIGAFRFLPFPSGECPHFDQWLKRLEAFAAA